MTTQDPNDAVNGPARAEPGPTPGTPTAEDLRGALKAFKKRLKLSRLDDESRLGQRALTKGGNSDIVAIQAPSQYPRAVWDELVKQGRLRYTGQGLYQLVNPAGSG